MLDVTCHREGCEGLVELRERRDTKHWGARTCVTCGAFSGWCKRPAKMANLELAHELGRFKRLLDARGAGRERGHLGDLLARGARYRDGLPRLYRRSLRVACERVSNLAKRGTPSPPLTCALHEVLERLEAANGWIESQVPAESPRSVGAPRQQLSLTTRFGEQKHRGDTGETPGQHRGGSAA